MFGCAMLYAIFQNILTYAALPHEPRLKKVFYLRLGCNCVHSIIVVVSLIVYPMMKSRMTVVHPSQIPTSSPAFVDRIILNVTEWITVTTIVMFLCSFYVEFDDLEISLTDSDGILAHQRKKTGIQLKTSYNREKEKLLIE